MENTLCADGPWGDKIVITGNTGEDVGLNGIWYFPLAENIVIGGNTIIWCPDFYTLHQRMLFDRWCH